MENHKSVPKITDQSPAESTIIINTQSGIKGIDLNRSWPIPQAMAKMLIEMRPGSLIYNPNKRKTTRGESQPSTPKTNKRRKPGFDRTPGSKDMKDFQNFRNCLRTPSTKNRSKKQEDKN